jgi:hypothetical protein
MRLITLILYLAIVSCQYNHRDLKAASSTGASSSSSSSSKTTTTTTKSTYTKSSSSSYKSSASAYKASVASYNANYGSNGVYTYSTYKNPTVTTNSYYSVSLGRTTQPLYVYYKAPNYYNRLGYYSKTYLFVYYDGYGYNFYYNTYGYYEYSVNQTPAPVRGEGGDGGTVGIIVGVILGVCFCGCFLAILYKT